MIITFYNEKIDPEVVKYQKKVFDFFGYTIHQIKPDNWQGHGGSIDLFLSNHKKRWEYIVLFDIDCIPLNGTVINDSINWVKNNNGLYSVAQKANHIPNSIVYASPAFLAFSHKTYDLLGRPTFSCTDRSDCAGELTHKSIELGYEVKLMYPSNVMIPKWDLTNDIKFGIGTTYENNIFHSFESRKNSNQIFLNKCKEILNGNKNI